MWSGVWFLLTSRISGGLTLALYHCGIFEYPILEWLKAYTAASSHHEPGFAKSDPVSGLLTPSATPDRKIVADMRVKFASPVARNLSPRARLQAHSGRGRATSEEVRDVPAWN